MPVKKEERERELFLLILFRVNILAKVSKYLEMYDIKTDEIYCIHLCYAML